MDKCKNIEELNLLKARKQNTHYKVKENIDTVTKDVDFAKRIVQVIPNTYYYFDSDQDVLITGACAKSITERGPQSTSPGKIKNVKDHNISVRIGNPQKIEETTIDAKRVLYGESKLLTTTIGNDMLIEYQEGVIDQHSIGFKYVDLELIMEEDQDWTKWLSQLINPEDAREYGYMFIVKEIQLMEWSPVSFGANMLTPYLGVKSGNKEALMLKVNDRIDLLEKQLRHGKQSDEAMHDYSLETLQLKQIIAELFSVEPSIKDTLLKGRQNKKDTQKEIITAFDLDDAIQKTKFFN